MFLTELYIQNFRNYSSLNINFKKSGAVFVGKNGSGKSNILEVIHLLCTGRSHRSSHRKSMIRFGENTTFSSGIFYSHEDIKTNVQFGFSSDNSFKIKINDQPISSYSELFGKRRIISFGPQDLLVIQGTPSERRNFLNMVLSQADDIYLKNLMAYKRDFSNRSHLLETKKNGRELDFYEEQLAQSGSELMIRRNQFFVSAGKDYTDFYSKVHGDNSSASISYRPSIKVSEWTKQNICVELTKHFFEMRKKDSEYRICCNGPHRDDFECSLNSERASQFASQGQCRAMSICLKLCSLSFLENRGENKGVIVLVDDAFGELDRERVSTILPLLKKSGQLFMTSTTPELPFTDEIERMNVKDGTVS